jgi:hypothetical protein
MGRSSFARDARHGDHQISFDGPSDASIKQLPRVRILPGPPASPLTRSPGASPTRNEADFPGKLAQKTTTKRLEIRGPFRSISALSAHFLQALIVEWLFPMHIYKAPALLQRATSTLVSTHEFSR